MSYTHSRSLDTYLTSNEMRSCSRTCQVHLRQREYTYSIIELTDFVQNRTYSVNELYKKECIIPLSYHLNVGQNAPGPNAPPTPGHNASRT